MNRPKRGTLTDWEARLMQIVWESGKVTADTIREKLREDGIKRSDSAIRKTLRVMEEKGVLQHTEQNRAYVYSATLTRESAERDGILHLSSVFFRGSPAALALKALDEAELTPDVIKEIRKKLREKAS